MATTKKRSEAIADMLVKELQLEAERLEKFGPEPSGTRAMLHIKAVFRGSPTAYSYAAVRVNDLWFLSGSGSPRQGMRWDDLCDWMEDTFEFASVYRPTQFVKQARL